MNNSTFLKLIHVVSISLLLLGCNEDDYNDITDMCMFPNFQEYECFEQPFRNEYDELVIEDNAAFHAYIDSLGAYRNSKMCDTTEFPSFDFENYVMLRKFASGGGCKIQFKRKVLQDFANLTITYLIEVKTSGKCDKLGFSNNWVLIPRKLFYDNVVFIVDE